MQQSFGGALYFCTLDMDSEIPKPQTLLQSFNWDVQHYNALYLAGKSSEPIHTLGQIESMPDSGLSATEKLVVVGDISDEVKSQSDIIIAQTDNFQAAEEIAAKLGYSPVKAGQFIQLLWLLYCVIDYPAVNGLNGWLFCYAGRKDGYAVLAKYNENRDGLNELIFDIHVGNDIKEGRVHANADTYCLFIRDN